MVRVMRYQYLQGDRRLTPASSGQTDDKGQFRVWGLMPGDYYVNAIARDASRVASLAAAQVERADQLLNNAVIRIEDLLSHMQSLVISTLREGNALMMGVRAVMAAIQAFRGRRRRRSEDDEALFI